MILPAFCNGSRFIRCPQRIARQTVRSLHIRFSRQPAVHRSLRPRAGQNRERQGICRLWLCEGHLGDHPGRGRSNHVDDYITGLKQTQQPGFEILKKQGIIDDYYTAVENGYSEGKPNVVIGVHYVNAEGLMPDQARDQMIDKEIEATMSEAAGKTAIAGYEKYRKLLNSSTWRDIDYKK